MSLKKLFSKNVITYKLYLYYNLFIKNKAHKKRAFYGQWGEDIFIQKYFKDLGKGFYVDIGCFHPVMYSNTYLLFNKGWAGLNIDLNQTSIDLYNILRPKDINICAAISSKEEEKELFFDHNFSPLNTLSKTFFDYSLGDAFLELKNEKISIKRIKTQTFEKIVSRLKTIPKINFLNVDCEGYDFQVLESFNLDFYKPELICVETHDIKNEKTEDYKKMTELLDNFNYKFVKRCGPSSFYSK